MNTQTQHQTILKQFTVVERALLYSRVSRDDRSKDGRNLDGQLDMGREYANEKGYRVVEELREDDKGASGAEIDLPKLNKILEMAYAGQFDVLIVRELDRLSRSIAKQLIVEEKLKRAGVRIEYVLAEYDDTPEGRLQKHVKATIAEYEREKIKERLTRGSRLSAEQGNVVSGQAPYGYRLIKSKKGSMLKPDKHEADIVKLIFDWYVFGDEQGIPLSMYSISERLNLMGVATRKGKPWIRSTVSAILKNETYAGCWHFRKEPARLDSSIQRIPVKVPAIIKREVWEAAQEQLERNKENSQRNRKPGRYLMATRVTCGECHYKMYGCSTGAKYGYYRCPSSQDGLNRDCHLPGFPVSTVDSRVWDKLEEVSSDKDKLLAGLLGYRDRQESKVAPIKRELAYVEDLIKRKTAEWEDDYASMKFLPERAKARKALDIADIENVLKQLEQRKGILLAQLETKSLTKQQISNIALFAWKVGQDMKTLRLAERDGIATPELRLKVYQAKRKLLEMLDVQVTLFVGEDGKKKARMTAKFCPDDLLIELDKTYSHILNRKNWVIISEVIDLD